METRRGFPRFGAFTARLRALTEDGDRGRTIGEAYPALLEWAEDVAASRHATPGDAPLPQ